jgi:hypothetical protein
MGKFNLADAAKAILTEGSKETFSSNVASKKGGQDKPAKLTGDVAYGTKEVGDIGTKVTKTTDSAPDATKGAPTATAPGATPPVGSEPMKKLSGQPAQSGSVEQPEGKTGKNQMPLNKGSVGVQQYEETETEGEVVAEEEVVSEEEKESAAHERKEAMKSKMKEKMKEDMDALLGGENLSEEFVTKATTIFEAAVIARAEMVIEEAEAELLEQFEEAVETIKEELASKVDDYLNYFTEEWIKENQIAVETGLRSEIVEDFIGGLKDLFEKHYIDIPAEKVDVVEGLTAKVEELEAQLNEQIQSSIELQKELKEQKKIEAIHAACEGLTQTQVEKMKSLAEGVEFTTEEEFNGKIETLKESYFKAEVKVADSSALDEVLIEEESKEVKSSGDPLVDAVAKQLTQSQKVW